MGAWSWPRGTSARNPTHRPAATAALPDSQPKAAPSRPHCTIIHQIRPTVTTVPTALMAKIARGRSMLAKAFEAGLPSADAKVAKASTVMVRP